MEIVLNGKKIDRIKVLHLGSSITDPEACYVIFDEVTESGELLENQVIFFNAWSTELESICLK